MRHLILAVSVASTSGCGTMATVIPQDGPSMVEVHRRHQQGSAVHAAARPARALEDGAAGLRGYTRSAHDELAFVFPRLPNPTLCGYVFPHLSEGGVPVPGYTTCFPMYLNPGYALPGEVRP